SVRRFEDPALIDNNLPVSWLFSLGTNVKSPHFSYNMWFIGCLQICCIKTKDKKGNSQPTKARVWLPFPATVP
ncbi:MAG: hypothetical protein PHT70_09450, partial [Bacteroidales bacterium]|nr:hypothetical protein [Bacteroidales bacterium]MDD3556589.1 hypothetical protein [Proteiniphilum sp.]MDD4486543.1 hypothetical protein [Proteiniphilum sp.]